MKISTSGLPESAQVKPLRNARFPKGARILCIGIEALEAAMNHENLSVSGYYNPFPPPPVPPHQSPGSVPHPESERLEELLHKSPHDLALVCVPNHTKNNLELEKTLLQSGISIACSKLRLRNWNDAQGLCEVARESGVSYYCSDHYHHAPTFQTARAILRRIGEVQTVNVRCRLPVAASGFNPWTKAYEHLVLEDLAYHHFAILAFLFGDLKIANAWCRSRSCAPDGRTHNDVHFVVSMASGWLLNYSARWGSTDPGKTSWHGEFVVEGTAGTLIVSDADISINGQSLSTEELLPRANWLGHILSPDYGRQKPPCLTTLEEFVPVAELIRTGLSINEQAPCF